MRARLSQVGDLGGGRHRGRAFQPGCDNGSCGVGIAQRLLEWAPFEQPVAEAAAEAVTGTETIDDADGNRWNSDGFGPGAAEHSLWTPLNDRQLDAEIEQGVRRTQRVALPDGYLT